MFCMSEEEKFMQIGRLAEEYSRFKEELNHVEKKVARVRQVYIFTTQNFQNLLVQGDKLVATPEPGIMQQPPADFHALLNMHELIELLNERERLRCEVKEIGDRLRTLAPHLI